MMLARDVAHTVDVDGMLASLTPQQFDEWIVMFNIWQEQRGDGEQQRPSLQQSLATFRGLAGV